MKIKNIQITPPPKIERDLQSRYGYKGIEMVRGAGKIRRPKLMLVFMNPTARNVSSNPKWEGLRAPWIGTKQVWRLLSKLKLLKEKAVSNVYNLKPEEWTEKDALDLYTHVADQDVYITNLASCTQPDARHLKDSIFREYLPVVYKEIRTVRPRKIIALGNQVSSILLQKPISVSNYLNTESELLIIGRDEFKVYPVYYPVGQGQRNIPKAIERVKLVMK